MQSLDEEITKLVAPLPRGLASSVRKKVAFYKSKQPALSPAEILSEVRFIIRLEMLAYMDHRKYLSMYNREWAEHKLHDYIKDIVKSSDRSERDTKRLARVNFDLNGLKAVNDLAGHDAGNKALLAFSNILKHGETTHWLKEELGAKVTVSAEGGDEFGLVVWATGDLTPHLVGIVERYSREVWNFDASALIDFGSKEVKEGLNLLGFSEVPSDFDFHISTSVGVSLFADALAEVDVAEASGSYDEVETRLVKTMFKVADLRSRAHKAAFKRELDKANPVLSALYARMSREVAHLQRELQAAEEVIAELKEDLSNKNNK